MTNDLEDSMILNTQSQIVVVIEVGFMSLINFVALIGNSWVCYSMLKNPVFHQAPNIYVFAVAVTNVLMSLLAMPLSLGVLITGGWSFGRHLCDIQSYCFNVLVLTSVQTVALSGINRLVRVVHPGLYRRWFTIDRSIAMILAVWVVVSLAVTFQIGFCRSYIYFRSEKLGCVVFVMSQHSNTVITVLFISLFVAFPILVLLASYTKVICVMRKHAMAIHSMVQFPRGNQPRRRLYANEIKLTRLLSALALGFLLCLIPAAVLELLNACQGRTSFPHWVYLTTTFLHYASCALHPIIYGALYKSSIRKAMPSTRSRFSHLQEHTV